MKHDLRSRDTVYRSAKAALTFSIKSSGRTDARMQTGEVSRRGQQMGWRKTQSKKLKHPSGPAGTCQHIRTQSCAVAVGSSPSDDMHDGVDGAGSRDPGHISREARKSASAVTNGGSGVGRGGSRKAKGHCNGTQHSGDVLCLIGLYITMSGSEHRASALSSRGAAAHMSPFSSHGVPRSFESKAVGIIGCSVSILEAS